MCFLFAFSAKPFEWNEDSGFTVIGSFLLAGWVSLSLRRKSFFYFILFFFSISIHDSLSCFTPAHTGARLQNGSGDRNLYFRWFCWTWKRQTFTFTPQFMRFLCFYFFFRCFVLFSMCLFFFSILGVLILEVLLISLLWNSSRTHSFTRIRTHSHPTYTLSQTIVCVSLRQRTCMCAMSVMVIPVYVLIRLICLKREIEWEKLILFCYGFNRCILF